MRIRMLVFALSALLLLTAQGPVLTEQSIHPFNLDTFANRLANRLKNRTVGYQFVVSFKGKVVEQRAGGVARRAPDDFPRTMTNDDKYNIASVSKTITAMAAMKLLRAKKVPLDTKMAKYLPSSFKPHTSVGNITFHNLLAHKSGIKCETGETQADLQKCLEDGINDADRGKFDYNNHNYALFRFLIPRLTLVAVGAGTPDNPVMIGEIDDYPAAYMDYVQKNVFDPAGLPKIFCKPTERKPALCYQWPCPDDHKGDDFGDMSDTPGARGWTLSSNQLATFFNAFLLGKIVPKDVVEQMKIDRLGLRGFEKEFDGGKKVSGVYHGGFYPGKREDGTLRNDGQLGSMVYALSNGVSLAFIINSQLGIHDENSRDVVTDVVISMLD